MSGGGLGLRGGFAGQAIRHGERGGANSCRSFGELGRLAFGFFLGGGFLFCGVLIRDTGVGREFPVDEWVAHGFLEGHTKMCRPCGGKNKEVRGNFQNGFDCKFFTHDYVSERGFPLYHRPGFSLFVFLFVLWYSFFMS